MRSELVSHSDAVGVLSVLVREVDARRRVALCAVIATRGSTPQVPGTLMCVDEAGRTTGTVGGGVTEAEVGRRARELLLNARGEAFTCKLDHDGSFGEGPICGGQMDVAVGVVSGPEEARTYRSALETLQSGGSATVPVRVQTASGLVEYRVRVEALPKLLIAGGGHIGGALADLAVPLGFHVSVVDDRREFANTERFRFPIEPVVGDVGPTLASWPIDPNTYVVIVTRGHQHDEQALVAVIASKARYIGMIGSRRKVATLFDHLRQLGVTQEQLERVHTPIGLDIHAITPEEIAVSIAAELISVRREGHRPLVEGPLPAAKHEA